MATITANPNPVVYTWPTLIRPEGALTTLITWDTQINAQGEVFESRDGGVNEVRSRGVRDRATEGVR